MQSINPVFIIVLAGVFAAMWTRLGARQPSTPIKFALGTIVHGHRVPALPAVRRRRAEQHPAAGAGRLILLMFTIAELLLSPVGLSLSTKLAPEAFHTQMVALFFLSIAVGSAGAGSLASLYDTDNERPYFLFLGAASIVVGIVLLAANRPISRLMEGVR